MLTKSKSIDSGEDILSMDELEYMGGTGEREGWLGMLKLVG